MPRFMYALNRAPKQRQKTTGFNLFSVFVREFVSRGEDNRAHIMARRASPYWKALTASQKRYWQCRADEIFRVDPDDTTGTHAYLTMASLPEDVSKHAEELLQLPLVELMPPSVEHFHGWYNAFTLDMLDVLSETLVSTTVEGYRARHSTSTRPACESASSRERAKPPASMLSKIRVRGASHRGSVAPRGAGSKPANRSSRQQTTVVPSPPRPHEQENIRPPSPLPSPTFVPAIPAIWYDPGLSSWLTNTTLCQPSWPSNLVWGTQQDGLTPPTTPSATHSTPSTFSPPPNLAGDTSSNFSSRSSPTVHALSSPPSSSAWQSPESWETYDLPWENLNTTEC
ncbi:hypothetical protein FKP32DRAFT_131818 [Trametes sanguinea]|nr:hypothetical protein FKP32DRAFT_131818 [Trametes sanguinea]